MVIDERHAGNGVEPTLAVTVTVTLNATQTLAGTLTTGSGSGKLMERFTKSSPVQSTFILLPKLVFQLFLRSAWKQRQHHGEICAALLQPPIKTASFLKTPTFSAGAVRERAVG